MVAQASLVADPAWLPHRIDLARRRVLFLHISRDQLAEQGFLADREGNAEKAWMPLEDYAAIERELGTLHFVFHSGFCRSTLLIRALDIPGISIGLNEPGILNSLVKAGPAGEALLRPTLALLSRPHARGEVVIVKPSNYANALIGAILGECPTSKAILTTDPVSVFLRRVAQKGLMGRLWARQVFLEVRAYTDDLGLDIETVAGMADLQVAGLGWFLYQKMFTDLLASEHGALLQSLWGERFNADRSQTLSAATAFFSLGVTASDIDSIIDGPVFRICAKGGGDFEETEARNVRRAESPVIAEAIAHVDKWIVSQAQRAGMQVPVPQNLF